MGPGRAGFDVPSSCAWFTKPGIYVNPAHASAASTTPMTANFTSGFGVLGGRTVDCLRGVLPGRVGRVVCVAPAESLDRLGAGG